MKRSRASCYVQDDTEQKKKDIQKARHAFEQEFQQEQEISERQPQEHQPFGNLKKKKKYNSRLLAGLGMKA